MEGLVQFCGFAKDRFAAFVVDRQMIVVDEKILDEFDFVGP
jgi:hypothetical protein